MIDLAVSLFTNPDVQIGTLIMKIHNNDDLFNPNVVKVIVSDSGNALFFSRSPIPFLRGAEQKDWLNKHEYFRHIGLYAYRANIILPIIGLSESPSEIAESLEQLRWLHHGYSVTTALTDIETFGVDTPDDLSKLTNNA